MSFSFDSSSGSSDDLVFVGTQGLTRTKNVKPKKKGRDKINSSRLSQNELNNGTQKALDTNRASEKTKFKKQSNLIYSDKSSDDDFEAEPRTFQSISSLKSRKKYNDREIHQEKPVEIISVTSSDNAESPLPSRFRKQKLKEMEKSSLVTTAPKRQGEKQARFKSKSKSLTRSSKGDYNQYKGQHTTESSSDSSDLEPSPLSQSNTIKESFAAPKSSLPPSLTSPTFESSQKGARRDNRLIGKEVRVSKDGDHSDRRKSGKVKNSEKRRMSLVDSFRGHTPTPTIGPEDDFSPWLSTQTEKESYPSKSSISTRKKIKNIISETESDSDIAFALSGVSSPTSNSGLGKPSKQLESSGKAFSRKMSSEDSKESTQSQSSTSSSDLLNSLKRGRNTILSLMGGKSGSKSTSSKPKLSLLSQNTPVHFDGVDTEKCTEETSHLSQSSPNVRMASKFSNFQHKQKHSCITSDSDSSDLEPSPFLVNTRNEKGLELDKRKKEKTKLRQTHAHKKNTVNSRDVSKETSGDHDEHRESFSNLKKSEEKHLGQKRNASSQPEIVSKNVSSPWLSTQTGGSHLRMTPSRKSDLVDLDLVISESDLDSDSESVLTNEKNYKEKSFTPLAKGAKADLQSKNFNVESSQTEAKISQSTTLAKKKISLFSGPSCNSNIDNNGKGSMDNDKPEDSSNNSSKKEQTPMSSTMLKLLKKKSNYIRNLVTNSLKATAKSDLPTVDDCIYIDDDAPLDKHKNKDKEQPFDFDHDNEEMMNQETQLYFSNPSEHSQDSDDTVLLSEDEIHNIGSSKALKSNPSSDSSKGNRKLSFKPFIVENESTVEYPFSGLPGKDKMKVVPSSMSPFSSLKASNQDTLHLISSYRKNESSETCSEIIPFQDTNSRSENEACGGSSQRHSLQPASSIPSLSLRPTIVSLTGEADSFTSMPDLLSQPTLPLRLPKGSKDPSFEEEYFSQSMPELTPVKTLSRQSSLRDATTEADETGNVESSRKDLFQRTSLPRLSLRPAEAMKDPLSKQRKSTQLASELIPEKEESHLQTPSDKDTELTLMNLNKVNDKLKATTLVTMPNKQTRGGNNANTSTSSSEKMVQKLASLKEAKTSKDVVQIMEKVHSTESDECCDSQETSMFSQISVSPSDSLKENIKILVDNLENSQAHPGAQSTCAAVNIDETCVISVEDEEVRISDTAILKKKANLSNSSIYEEEDDSVFVYDSDDKELFNTQSVFSTTFEEYHDNDIASHILSKTDDELLYGDEEVRPPKYTEQTRFFDEKFIKTMEDLERKQALSQGLAKSAARVSSKLSKPEAASAHDISEPVQVTALDLSKPSWDSAPDLSQPDAAVKDLSKSVQNELAKESTDAGATDDAERSVIKDNVVSSLKETPASSSSSEDGICSDYRTWASNERTGVSVDEDLSVYDQDTQLDIDLDDEGDDNCDPYLAPTQIACISDDSAADISGFSEDDYLAHTQLDYILISSDDEGGEEEEEKEEEGHGNVQGERATGVLSDDDHFELLEGIAIIKKEKLDQDGMVTSKSEVVGMGDGKYEANTVIVVSLDSGQRQSHEQVENQDDDTLESSPNPYLSETINDDGNISDEEDNPYMASTQVDEVVDPYDMQTQVNIDLDAEESPGDYPDPYELDTQIDSPVEEEADDESNVSDYTGQEGLEDEHDTFDIATQATMAGGDVMLLSKDDQVSENNIVEYIASTQIDAPSKDRGQSQRRNPSDLSQKSGSLRRLSRKDEGIFEVMTRLTSHSTSKPDGPPKMSHSDEEKYDKSTGLVSISEGKNVKRDSKQEEKGETSKRDSKQEEKGAPGTVNDEEEDDDLYSLQTQVDPHHDEEEEPSLQRDTSPDLQEETNVDFNSEDREPLGVGIHDSNIRVGETKRGVKLDADKETLKNSEESQATLEYSFDDGIALVNESPKHKSSDTAKKSSSNSSTSRAINESIESQPKEKEEKDKRKRKHGHQSSSQTMLKKTKLIECQQNNERLKVDSPIKDKGVRGSEWLSSRRPSPKAISQHPQRSTKPTRSSKPNQTKRKPQRGGLSMDEQIKKARLSVERRYVDGAVSGAQGISHWRNGRNTNAPETDLETLEMPSTQEILDLGLPINNKLVLVDRKKNKRTDKGKGTPQDNLPSRLTSENDLPGEERKNKKDRTSSKIPGTSHSEENLPSSLTSDNKLAVGKKKNRKDVANSNSSQSSKFLGTSHSEENLLSEKNFQKQKIQISKSPAEKRINDKSLTDSNSSSSGQESGLSAVSEKLQTARDSHPPTPSSSEISPAVKSVEASDKHSIKPRGKTSNQSGQTPKGTFQPSASNKPDENSPAGQSFVSRHPFKPPGTHPSSTISTKGPRRMAIVIQNPVSILKDKNKTVGSSGRPRNSVKVKFDDSRNQVNFVEPRATSHTPTVPVHHERLQPTMAVASHQPPPGFKSVLHENDLIFKILYWSSAWLPEQDKHTDPPPILGKSVSPFLRTSYDDIESYQKTNFDLLLLEMWASIHSEWKKSPKETTLPTFLCRQPYHSDKREESCGIITFELKVIVPQAKRQQVPGPLDLIILHMCGTLNANPGKPKYSDSYQQFAIVREVRDDTSMSCKEDFFAVRKHFPSFSDPKAIVVRIKVCLKYRKFVPSEIMKIQPVTRLMSSQRQFLALVNVTESPVTQALINPNGNNPVFFLREDVGDSDLKSLNKEQTMAVGMISQAVTEIPRDPKICLLQGPPGTGKSHTILATIHRILMKTKFKARILLAAPSNAAVDEMAKRIINFSIKKCSASNLSGINVLRVGQVERVSEQVKPYHYDNVLREKLLKFQYDKSPSLRDEVNMVKKRMDALQASTVSEAQKVANREELRRLRQDLTRLESGVRNQSVTSSEKRRLQDIMVEESHVICCTLNSFGSPFHQSMLRYRFGATQKRQFDCLIVDEATQSIEMETLIPFQYGMCKVVLVGDQKQLPATVNSKEARDGRFDRSLFERLHLKLTNTPGRNPIITLREQYRMHPEILLQPNSYFYHNQLFTNESVAKKSRNSALSPYLVFDIHDGQEVMDRGGSYSNKLEAEFISELCQRVSTTLNIRPSQLSSRIGIICPYASQKLRIQDCLRHKKSNLEEIDVNTVDSFQGQEKDVIILSLVRSQSKPQSIGFVGDPKRMNVSLTRAKLALYIVGNFKTLSISELWKLLHDNAKERNLLVQVSGWNVRSSEPFQAINRGKKHP